MSSTPMRVLLRVRQQTLRGQVRSLKPGANLGRAGLLLLGLVGLVLAGATSADALVEAAARRPSPGQVVTPGGPYAELAFWLTTLVITVLSFRIMEGLYRHRDARLISSLPISLTTQFNDRLISAGLESMLALVAMMLFLSPIALISGDPRAYGSILLCAGGLAVNLTLGFAVQLYAGVTSFIQGGGSQLESIGRLDAGGGTAAAFYISPGIAMASSLGLLLWMKMAALDEFFIRGTSRLFWIGLLLPLAVCAVSLFKSRAWFVAHYPRLLARFYEADLIQLDTGYNYHKSVTHGRRGVFEHLVPTNLLCHCRKDALQLGRRYPMLRLLAVALWIAVGVLSSRDAQSLGAAVSLAYIAALSSPWARLYGSDLEPDLSSLPASPELIHRAKLAVALREAVVLALPSAAIIVAFGPSTEGLATAGAVAAGALLLTLGLTFATRRLGAASGRAAGVVVAALIVGVGVSF